MLSSLSSCFTCPRLCCHCHRNATGLLAWTEVEWRGGYHLSIPTCMLATNAFWHWFVATPAYKMRFPIYYLLRLSSYVFLLICLAACRLFFLVSVLSFAWQPCRLFFLASVLLCFPAYSAVLPATVPSKAATVSPACFVLSSSSPRTRGFPSMFPGFTGSRDCVVPSFLIQVRLFSCGFLLVQVSLPPSR